MKRFLKCMVVESSDLLYAGLVAMLGQIRAGIRVVRVQDVSRLREQIKREQPDVLFLNPLDGGGETPSKIKANTDRPDLLCVAFLSDLSSLSVAPEYDAQIGIYDSFEQIRDKMEALSPKGTEEEKTLSQREKEIVTYVVKGLTNKQIADKLFLSQHTVVTHRRNIASKLNIHSSAGLTVYAIASKLVRLEDIGGGMKGA
ncbi:MAG: LuxR C-terminal-related transcriptional regulator [Bacteroidales bacterium]|nr:LuxR C-terminal-related transcriptional regulator [Bacteroidales bacterium]